MPDVPTVATLVSEEDQVAYTFTFCELPSVQVPFALTCAVAPGAISAAVEVSAILFSVAELTVKPVFPVWLAPAKLNDALTLAGPCLTPTAMPVLLPVDPKAATAELSELQRHGIADVMGRGVTEGSSSRKILVPADRNRLVNRGNGNGLIVALVTVN